ncbi:MAG: flavodoxin-dependent (E)-4-hydroxy-3-methylbut-2-enyl-diphosphate synthase [Oscillospiraceae bacterium]|jgi:(E)-4-hydroxy-3-methylbut-2-enyl-diphosphate synthase|nr:flavodoxin-dependent (E)-4-hydroxy-3-methylbut-2-enyl-diphosphate synthase [Oscillospiraceae bacterium]
MTRQINVGGVPVGGGAPVAVQSMCDTDTRDIRATLEQITRLRRAGCQLARVAVPTPEAAAALRDICKESPLPVIADIHYSHSLALAALEAGAAKIRVNPGNMPPKHLRTLAAECAARRVPIRVGANAGSLREGEGLVSSAMRQVTALEELGFFDICVSVKSASAPDTWRAYRQISALTSHPLHIGVTEAGLKEYGIIKSAVAIGALLLEGIGDTVRVSLTARPEEEVAAALAILKACRLREQGLELISCPLCGRSDFPVELIARQLAERLSDRAEPVTVAVMGCSVNGPGEAAAADFGVCGAGAGKAALFRKGKIAETVPREAALERLLEYINAETSGRASREAALPPPIASEVTE